MMRPSMKRLALSSTAALLLVGGGWVWLQDSSAATTAAFPSTGQTFSCGVSRNPLISLNLGPDVSTASTGVISATVGKTSKTTDGRETADVTVLSTLTRGTAEGIGDITIANDTSRPTPPSSLTSNQVGRSFPATQVMRFHPVVTLNGETFRTASTAAPAALVNTSVSAFPAPAGTSYTLTNALTLESSSGNTLTVEAGRVVTITGSSSS
jgi:hypothetical protein